MNGQTFGGCSETFNPKNRSLISIYRCPFDFGLVAVVILQYPSRSSLALQPETCVNFLYGERGPSALLSVSCGAANDLH